MRTFNISRTLADSIANVLTRRAIPYEIVEDNGKLICRVDISGKKFHKIVLRAKMEKLQDERNSIIPFVAKPERDDPEVMEEVGHAYYVE